MEKPKEVPAFTKPVGKPGDERSASSIPKKAPTREHPHKVTKAGGGYSNVGKPGVVKGNCKPGGEREDCMVAKKEPARKHPHQGK